MLHLVILHFTLLLAAPAASSAEPQAPPTVTTINHEELMSLVRREKGSVLLLNMWATWCVPCIEEFPEILRLRADYIDSDLVVHFVSLDRIRSRDTHVRPFLARMGVDFETYLKKQGNDEAFINALSDQWSGALPATFIVDRSGKLQHLLVGEQTLDDLRRLVIPLLGDSD
jgi:thiol-disulfide isomerase/thioredoxin